MNRKRVMTAVVIFALLCVGVISCAPEALGVTGGIECCGDIVCGKSV